MVKLIRAEWYKACHRPYFRNTLLCCVLCTLSVVTLLSWMRSSASGYPDHINLPFAAIGILFVMSAGMYLVVIGADLAFSEQYKFGTLKNEVSFGLSRTGSYLSRWAAAMLFMLLMLAVLVGSYLLFSLVMLGMPSDETAMAQFGTSAAQSLSTALGFLGYYLLTSLPLWMAGLSIMLCLMFLVPSSTMAAMSYVVLLAAVPGLLQRLGIYVNSFFTFLYHLMPTYPFTQMVAAQNGTLNWALTGQTWALGLGWTAAACLVGVALFRRKEIK